MLHNYEYFLTLAETLNISQASRQLFISHQCLSRYLKNLEEELGMTLFDRKPHLSLTYAGQILRNSLRQVQLVEQDTRKVLAELKNGSTGQVRLGIPEGRLRIFLPELLRRYQQMYPNVVLTSVSASTKQMMDRLLNNQLDIVLGSTTGYFVQGLKYESILEESLYLVVSENLLKKYFQEDISSLIETFSDGADLSLFQEMPFCITNRGLYSRSIIDEFLLRSGISLRYVYQAAQPDLLHILTAQDYGASFCLSMYLSYIHKLNREGNQDNPLYVFPIQGLDVHNPIYLVTLQGKYFPQYTRDLAALIRRQCMEQCRL